MERLKIFVSSTQRDLQPERDSVQAAIEHLGHDCLRAETYGSPGESPRDACCRMARDCDIYVGVYGAKYGYIDAETGMSVTELEYRHARQCSAAKVFVYLKEVTDLEPEQEKFLQEVQDFSNGYFRHGRFQTTDQLSDYIRRDVITWMTRQIRLAIIKEREMQALRTKVELQARIMELYGVPEDLR